MYLCEALGLVFCLEQPESSLAKQHKRFQEYLRERKLFHRTYYLSDWGAPSPKPLILYSNNADFLNNIDPVDIPAHARPAAVQLTVQCSSKQLVL
jgi:hypothetical protein